MKTCLILPIILIFVFLGIFTLFGVEGIVPFNETNQEVSPASEAVAPEESVPSIDLAETGQIDVLNGTIVKFNYPANWAIENEDIVALVANNQETLNVSREDDYTPLPFEKMMFVIALPDDILSDTSDLEAAYTSLIDIYTTQPENTATLPQRVVIDDLDVLKGELFLENFSLSLYLMRIEGQLITLQGFGNNIDSIIEAMIPTISVEAIE